MGLFEFDGFIFTDEFDSAFPGYRKRGSSKEYIPLHNYVYWKHTGLIPKQGETVIHHIDGNRKNNEFDNLELITTKRQMKPMLNQNSDILSISENNAVNYIKNHEFLNEPLLLYVNKIKEYLRALGKYDDVYIMLQGSPEIHDFNVVVIYIKTEFSDIDEKLELYDDIGDILNEVTNEIVADVGEEMYDKLQNVTYLIGEVDD